jgi:hypothetical protein
MTNLPVAPKICGYGTSYRPDRPNEFSLVHWNYHGQRYCWRHSRTARTVSVVDACRSYQMLTSSAFRFGAAIFCHRQASPTTCCLPLVQGRGRPPSPRKRPRTNGSHTYRPECRKLGKPNPGRPTCRSRLTRRGESRKTENRQKEMGG